MGAGAGVHAQEPARLLGAARLSRRGGPLEGDALLVVTFTTDFGEGSPYVAALKAAVLAECPGAQLVDITHSVPPFDVDAGAFLLWAGARHFAAGSVHVAVIDPGVGTARRRVAVRAAGRFYVGPDNGLFDLLSSDVDAAVELPRPPSASRTFEGRDIFAPAAGRLAAGAELATLGGAIDHAGLTRLADRGGRVVWVDRFGNLVTSLSGPARALRVGDVEVAAVAGTFADVPPGEPFCYLGSLGRLEVGVREGRADEMLGAGPGTPVS